MSDPISALNAINYVAYTKKLFSDVENWSKPAVEQEVPKDAWL